MDVTISDAEWQVMNVIWDGQPLGAAEIVEQLSADTDWAPATIKTMLHRLVKKEVLTYSQTGNRYVYRARAQRAQCVKRESKSFLQRVFSGEAAPAVAHLIKTTKLSAAEISELRELLNEQEARQ